MKLLTLEEINDIFFGYDDMTEFESVFTDGDNEYYPHDENDFSESEISELCKQIRISFPNIKIENIDDFERTYIIVDSIEQWIFIYSYVNSITC